MKKDVIAIVMGSDSDLLVLTEGLELLETFGVPFTVRILSAHRTPKHITAFTRFVHEEGIKVVIAAAGGAAHLPGVIAASVVVPVIGVPIVSKTLSGIDSLYSIVQMPSGVPVATVGINAAKNAVLLAIQILSLSDSVLKKKYQLYKSSLEAEVLKKDQHITHVGWKHYDS